MIKSLCGTHLKKRGTERDERAYMHGRCWHVWDVPTASNNFRVHQHSGPCPSIPFRSRTWRIHTMRKLPVVPICRGALLLPQTPHQWLPSRIPHPLEGRFAVVTDVGSGM